jgi:hypothetical protein
VENVDKFGPGEYRNVGHTDKLAKSVLKQRNLDALHQLSERLLAEKFDAMHRK